MIRLFCTRKLAARLGTTEAMSPTPTDGLLGDWHAHVVTLQRRPYVLAISGRTRLPVLLTVKERGTLERRFGVELGRVLVAIGIPLRAAAEEAQRASAIEFGRAYDRSLLGTLNDFIFQALAHCAYGDGTPVDPLALALHLADTPVGPRDYFFPDIATRTLFGVPEEPRVGQRDDSIL